MNSIPSASPAVTSAPAQRTRGPRRPLTAVAALAVTALALTACGSSTADDGGNKAAGSRVVATAHGKVTVPTHPLRVVSVHSWSTESLYDLGVKPVGVEDSGATYVPPRYLGRWKAATKVTTGADIDYEKIASLGPDLIVGVDVPYLSKAYKKLSAIAPTVFASFDDKADWSAYPRATAEFVNRTARLAALREKYDDRIAAVRRTYGSRLADSHWDVVQGGFDTGNYWIYGPTSAVGDILGKLGAGFASATASVTGGGTRSVSYERTDLLEDADHIIYYTNNDGSPANDIQKLFALDTFKALPAAKKHAVIGTADFLPGSYMDALGVIDSVESALRKQAG